VPDAREERVLALAVVMLAVVMLAMVMLAMVMLKVMLKVMQKRPARSNKAPLGADAAAEIAKLRF
jgi:uncharacterized membrane protein